MSRRRSLLFISVLVLVGAGASFGVGILGSELASVYASIGLSFVAATLLVLVATAMPRPTVELNANRWPGGPGSSGGSQGRAS